MQQGNKVITFTLLAHYSNSYFHINDVPRHKQEYIVEMLLQYDDQSPTSIHHILRYYCFSLCYDSMLRFRYKNRRDETPLLIAVEAGYLDIIQILMDAGSNPVEPCIRGWSAVHEAAVQGDIHILTKLLMSGVNLDIPDCYGCTPLFSSSMQGKHEVAELLCQRGANANEKTIGNPATPLHEAARRGDLKMCEILMEYHADPNLQDKKGNAPIHVAAFGDHAAVVALLSDKTSKRRIHNLCGKSPLVS